MKRRILVTGGSGFIGTNVVEACLAAGDDVLSIDIAPPRLRDHRDLWRRANLLDEHAVAAVLSELDPTHVIHLAARTDLRGRRLADYAVNAEGTLVLLEGLRRVPALQRMVLASSMLVCRNGYTPTSDTDYCPNTVYGRSKQLMEDVVRARADAVAPWVLVRPTSIWGPWFGEPYRRFFELVLERRYVHPGRRQPNKALGYIGNTVAQILALLDHDAGLDSETVYLTDTPPYSIRDWAETIRREAEVGSIPTVPVPLLRAAAIAGDLLQRAGVMKNPPMTSFRLDNMLTGSSFETERLLDVTGPLPYSMEEGVIETLGWLRQQPDAPHEVHH